MSKKNIFLKIATIFLFAIAPVLLLLSACGKKDHYFTIDALPSHVSRVEMQAYGSDSKGNFLPDGDIANIYITIEDGYELGTLKVLSNGEELTLNEESVNLYKTTFKPTKDFAITFTGAVAPKVANIRLAVGRMMYPDYHDRIMVEIDRYDLFGLEKWTMNIAEFKQAVENIGSSPVQTNYDTPITISVYTIGTYDFAISESCVLILNNNGDYGVGFNRQVEKIVDEENQKYGYKHTIRFSENNTITIVDEVVEEYSVKFVYGDDDVSMHRDLFTLSVNGETRAKPQDYYVYGVIKVSDFTGEELPKLKIDFLKYTDENYKKFYNELTFDLAGKQAKRSADGSYVEIEFDKYYKYNFKHESYVVSTNALDLLKKMDIVTEKSYGLIDKIEINGNEEYGYFVISEVNSGKSLGRTNGFRYFLKDDFLTLTINFFSEVDYQFVRFGKLVVKVDDSTLNSDVIVKKEQYEFDGETKASRFTITVRASVPTEKIEFFTNNP